MDSVELCEIIRCLLFQVYRHHVQASLVDDDYCYFRILPSGLVHGTNQERICSSTPSFSDSAANAGKYPSAELRLADYLSAYRTSQPPAVGARSYRNASVRSFQ